MLCYPVISLCLFLCVCARVCSAQDGSRIRGSSSLSAQNTEYTVRVMHIPAGKMTLLQAYLCPYGKEKTLSRTLQLTDYFDHTGRFLKSGFLEEVKKLHSDLLQAKE